MQDTFTIKNIAKHSASLTPREGHSLPPPPQETKPTTDTPDNQHHPQKPPLDEPQPPQHHHHQEGEKEPHELAEMCLRELVSRATYGKIDNVVKPLLT